MLQRKERQKEQQDQTEEKGGGRKGESNDSPEFPDRRGIWHIPRLPSGVSVAKASHIRTHTHTHKHTCTLHTFCATARWKHKHWQRKYYFLLQRQMKLFWYIQTSTFNNMCVLLKLLISVYTASSETLSLKSLLQEKQMQGDIKCGGGGGGGGGGGQVRT